MSGTPQSAGERIVHNVHPERLGQLIPLAELRPYWRNYNNGDVDSIAESLTVNGQYKAVTVNRGTITGRPGEVLAGAHTYAAALQLGWTHMAGDYVDVDEEAAARINVVDNMSARRARPDKGLLAGILTDLPDLMGTGVSREQLDRLIAGNNEPLLPDGPQPDPEPASSGTVTCPSCGERYRP